MRTLVPRKSHGYTGIGDVVSFDDLASQPLTLQPMFLGTATWQQNPVLFEKSFV